jgi:hypothetical protein
MLFQDGQVTSRTSKLTGLAVPFGSAPNWNICVTQFNPTLAFKNTQAFNYSFTSRSRLLAEEEGIQPSVALTDSRQFSGLVTLATRPLLRI